MNKKLKSQVVIKSQKAKKTTQYEDLRIYTKEQIDEFVKEDQLPEPLASQTAKYLSKRIK